MNHCHSCGTDVKRAPKDVRFQIQLVIDTGKFNGIGGKVREASDDMIQFLSDLLESWKSKAVSA